MIDFLKNIIPRIKTFSEELDSLTKLYDQPWVLMNDLEKKDFVKIIFNQDNKLLISKNGNVSTGSWQIFTTAKSLLLNIENNQTLYNQVFIDPGILILKPDGFSNDLFILANQNKIPDFDIIKYLEEKYLKKDNSINHKAEPRKGSLKIKTEKVLLQNGEELTISSDKYNRVRAKADINGIMPKNDFYRLKNEDVVYNIRNGEIINEFYLEKYQIGNDQTLEVAGCRINGIIKGNPVWVNGEIAPDGFYRKGWLSRIEVQNGKIV